MIRLRAAASIPFRIGKKQDRIARRTELDPLIDARQKAAPPEAVAGSGDAPGDQDDEAGRFRFSLPRP